MSNQNELWTLGIDANNAKRDLLALNDLLSDLSTEVNANVRVMLNFNEAGELSAATVTELIDKYSNLVTKYKLLAEEGEIAGRVIQTAQSTTADAISRTSDEMRDAGAELKRYTKYWDDLTESQRKAQQQQISKFERDRSKQINQQVDAALAAKAVRSDAQGSYAAQATKDAINAHLEDRKRVTDAIKQGMLARVEDEADVRRRTVALIAEMNRETAANLKYVRDRITAQQQRADGIAAALRREQSERAAIYNTMRNDEQQRVDAVTAALKREQSERAAIYNSMKRDQQAGRSGGFGGAFSSALGGKFDGFSSGDAAAVALGTFAGGAVLAGIAALGSAMRSTAQEANALNREIAQIQTISQDAQLTTAEWTEGIAKLSGELGRSRQEIATGVYEAVSNQIAQGRGAIDFAGQAGNLSLITGSTNVQAVNALSSVLNAYNMKATQATEVSSAFYKAIDIGRFRLQDIADTIGRTTLTASQLGININEVLGALAVLTRSGLPVSEAMTLINNLMYQLTKPSEAMVKLFKEWGSSSGQAAIQSFGFANVIGRISDATKGSSEEVGKLFPEIRAMRAEFGLGSNGAKELVSAIDQVGNSSRAAANALVLVRQSASQILAEDFQKLKNVLVLPFQGFMEIYKEVRLMTGADPTKSAEFRKSVLQSRIDESRNSITSKIEAEKKEVTQGIAELRRVYYEKDRVELESAKEQTEALRSELRSRLTGMGQDARDGASEAARLMQTAKPFLRDNRARDDMMALFGRKDSFLAAFGVSERDLRQTNFRGRNFKEFQDNSFGEHRIRGGDSSIYGGNPIGSLFQQLGLGGNTNRIEALRASAGRSLSMGNIDGWKRDLKEIDKILNDLFQTNLTGAAQAAQAGDWMGFSRWKRELLAVNRLIQNNTMAERRQEDSTTQANIEKAEGLRTQAENTRATLREIEKAEQRLFALKPGDARNAFEAQSKFDQIAGFIFDQTQTIDPEKAQQVLQTLSGLKAAFTTQATDFFQFKTADEQLITLEARYKEMIDKFNDTGVLGTAGVKNATADLEQTVKNIVSARGDLSTGVQQILDKIKSEIADIKNFAADPKLTARIEKAQVERDIINNGAQSPWIKGVGRGATPESRRSLDTGDAFWLNVEETLRAQGQGVDETGAPQGNFNPNFQRPVGNTTVQGSQTVNVGPVTINATNASNPEALATETINVIERKIQRGEVRPFSTAPR